MPIAHGGDAMEFQDTERLRNAAMGVGGLLPVRLIIFGVSAALVAILATVLSRLLVPPAPSPLHQLVMVKNLVLPVLELLVYAAIVRRLEHRPASEIAVDRNGATLLGIGLVIGLTLVAAAILTLALAGLATFASGTGLEGLFAEILVPFTTAVIEELIFRAILFRLAEAMFGTTIAALLSSLLFALAHLGNPGATAITTIFLALDLGLLLAVAFAASRSLWLPIGLHMGWNLALGYVFGVSNSGTLSPHNLLRTTLAGPAWLSGGVFGLESSVVALAFSLLSSAALIAIAMRYGRWQPISLRLRAPQ